MTYLNQLQLQKKFWVSLLDFENAARFLHPLQKNNKGDKTQTLSEKYFEIR